jgi:deazaflavin-dependent oxidoreductase (nitroreductase family)
MSSRRPPLLFSLLAPRLMKWYSKSNAAVYRATGGRLWGRELGLPVCLVTTIGRRSRLPRTNTLVYLRDGARIVVVAAQGGLSTHPQWLLNLRVNPEVRVQIRADIRTMHARIADDVERAQLWPRLIALNPRWARFQGWTQRQIPVVVCDPVNNT